MPGARQLAPDEELASVLIKDASGDRFGKLARYEVMLERRLGRAVHELERMQAARRGEPVAPPVAVDVTVFASENIRSQSGTETPTADASPASSDEASDARAAQPVPEMPCPAIVDAVDATALPGELSAPIEGGTPADTMRSEPTGAG